MLDCTDYSAEQYPELREGMRVKLYNGEEGEIIATDNYYFALNDNSIFHRMDIKIIFNP